MSTIKKISIKSGNNAAKVYDIGGDTILASSKYSGGVFAKTSGGGYPSIHTGYWRGYPSNTGGTTTPINVNSTITFNGFTATINTITKLNASDSRSKPFHNNINNHWWSGGSATSSVLEFTTSKAVAFVGFYNQFDSNHANSGHLEYNDGSNWVQIATATVSTSPINSVTVLDTNSAIKSTRWRIRYNGAPNNGITVFNLRLYINASTDNPTNPFPNNDGSTATSSTFTANQVHDPSSVIVASTKPYIEVQAGDKVFIESTSTSIDDVVYTINAGDYKAFTTPANSVTYITKV